jgi:hypothetical protein
MFDHLFREGWNDNISAFYTVLILRQGNLILFKEIPSSQDPNAAPQLDLILLQLETGIDLEQWISQHIKNQFNLSEISLSPPLYSRDTISSTQAQAREFSFIVEVPSSETPHFSSRRMQTSWRPLAAEIIPSLTERAKEHLHPMLQAIGAAQEASQSNQLAQR